MEQISLVVSARVFLLKLREDLLRLRCWPDHKPYLLRQPMIAFVSETVAQANISKSSANSRCEMGGAFQPILTP
ncbi:hypothetical protein CJ030_MR4G004192 [Morella rubra]|uniref:Uncharacterized protein n=1 Tax=Morella rubra TaxID=262757 RepID=A0A6A1VR40_9ROSI|nr:hypothetical protein CJ030_MR4G004192 [Morella rubra]